MLAATAPFVLPVPGESFVRPFKAGYGLRLIGATSGYVGLKPAAAAGSIDFTLPSADAAGCWVSDGAGNLSLETASQTKTRLGLGATDDPTFGDLVVDSLTILNPAVIINSTTLHVADPLIKLGVGNPSDLLDLGFYGTYTATGSKYAGLFRDATDGKFKLFTALEAEPTTTVNTSGTGYAGATLVVGTIEATTYVGYPATNPAGVGTELQYRNGSAFGAISGSSWSAGILTLPTAVIVPSSINDVGLTIKGASSQAANLQNWTDNTPTVLSSVLADGSFHIKSTNAYRGILIDAVNGAGVNASLTFFNGAAAYGTIGLQGTVFSISTSAYTNVSPAAQFVSGKAYFSSDTNLYGSAECNAEIQPSQGYAAFQAVSRGIAASTDYGLLITSGVTYLENQTMLSLNGAAVFNEGGNDADFRVEGDTEAYLFFVDASVDRVVFGTNTAEAAKVTIVNNGVDNGSRADGIRVTLNGGTNTSSSAGYFSSQNRNTCLALETVGKSSFGGTLNMNNYDVLNVGNIGVGGVHSSTAGNLQVNDLTSTFAGGNGGNVLFAGDERGQGQPFAIFANIRGIKENGSYLNSLGALVFGTQSNSGAAQGLSTVTEKMRITSGGLLGVGTTLPSALIHGIKTTEQLRLGYDATYYTSFTVSSTGLLTIAPSGGTTNFQSSIGLKIIEFVSTATNDDPTVSIYQNRVATTDATVTTLHTIAIADNTTYALTATVECRCTGGAGGNAGKAARFDFISRARRSGGIALLGTVTATYTDQDGTAWAATFDVDGGNNARIRVTGGATDDIVWHVVELKVSPLSA